MLLQRFSPLPELSPYIDSLLLQEDFNRTNFANRNPVKVLPSAMTVIGIQYGQPMKRLENDKVFEMGSSGLTGVQTSVKEYLSTGAIGTIIVQFKPGGLTPFTAYPIHEFQDANTPLDLIFPSKEVHEMEERLLYATHAADRVGIVQRFLVCRLRNNYEEHSILYAAQHIMKRHGDVSIERLATQSYMSKRTLERKFNALIGASPKHFASIVRFQHAIRLHNAGNDYLDIVQACGYSDHAHFAKSFKAFAGRTPAQFFNSEFQPELKKSFNKSDASSSTDQQLYF
ncbi:helix-turn-helix domain-containing protein [Paenibacillus sp. 2TAB23]|uniref:helix-turn-helix domain-containing protein n=1 Tax=Paenibacillus sp. 2TAB23 TaxID=3233004 RepID=UPI003F99E558